MLSVITVSLGESFLLSRERLWENVKKVPNPLPCEERIFYQGVTLIIDPRTGMFSEKVFPVWPPGSVESLPQNLDPPSSISLSIAYVDKSVLGQQET